MRTTKTASGKVAVQVVNSTHQKTLVIKHLGSASTEPEIERLRLLGRQYIERQIGVVPLFPEFSSLTRRQDVSKLMATIEIGHTRHLAVYQLLSSWYRHCGFDSLNAELLKDLSLIRLVEPTSKQQSVVLLKRYFLKHYSLTSVYRALKAMSSLKHVAESVAVAFAKKQYAFDFRLVFYDVTTLYFESFTPDEFRKCGFSKDNKANQPQIVVGLVVDSNGFPISYALFKGNVFEGHTMIPVILELKKRYHIETLTVVADAAMLSLANMEELKRHGLFYIVGARLGNLPDTTILQISRQLGCTERTYSSLNTAKGILICDYSKRRAMKDKSERNKQLQRAEFQIAHPEQAVKRSKFVKQDHPTHLMVNYDLVHKAELLEGVKGYYTNITTMNETTIVERYHELWHVEKSFRMAKSDLLARPMYHFKRQNIEAHLLIVFISLCLAKSLELATSMSMKRIMELLWDIEDVEFHDTQTHDVYHKQTTIISTELQGLVAKIQSAY